jgi:adenosylcobinamide-GDP ribazoletransferase
MRAADAVLGPIALLTRIPVGRSVGAADAARGAVLFPLVGAAIGAAVGGTALLLEPTLPALLAAAVAVVVELALTGALHLDGLADTADALGGRTRKDALEIMRDPRLGTFGAAAIVLDLLVRTAAIAALLERGGLPVSAVAAGALGRSAILPLAVGLAYARPGGGLSERISAPAAFAGIGLAAALSIALAGWIGAAMLGAAGLGTVALGAAYRTRFGGVTGDTLGAAVEVSTTLALLVSVALR